MLETITINRESYLSYSLKLKPEEIEIQKKLMRWLPEEIIDAHAHCNLHEHLLEIDQATYCHMISTFTSFSLQESQQSHTLFLPGKKVRSLRFALPFCGLDFVKANNYLLGESPIDDRVALVIPPGHIEYASIMLGHPRVSAVKMYHKHCDPWAKSIYECFSPQILEMIQERQVPIILHAPQMIIKSCSEIVRMVKDFPRLKVAIAHLGSHKLPQPELTKTFEELAHYPQIYMDTAMNPSSEIVKMALDIFGTDRIMFGSDEPIHMVRSGVYINPDLGERLMTEFPYHWVDLAEHMQYGHLATNVTHALWRSLMAIYSAVENINSASLSDMIKQKIFFNNAKNFFDF